MASFDCDGWIHITLDDNCIEAHVRVIHRDDHTPYCVIDIPDHIRTHVLASINKTPSQASDLLCLSIQ